MKQGASAEPSVMSFGEIPPSDAGEQQGVAFGRHQGFAKSISCAPGFSWTLDCERLLAGGEFLAAGQAGLKSRTPDARDDDHRRQAKIGELLMETELLYAKVDQLEAGGPLARRRSTR